MDLVRPHVVEDLLRRRFELKLLGRLVKAIPHSRVVLDGRPRKIEHDHTDFSHKVNLLMVLICGLPRRRRDTRRPSPPLDP